MSGLFVQYIVELPRTIIEPVRYVSQSPFSDVGINLGRVQYAQGQVERDGAGACGFGPAKALIRGLKPLPKPSPIQGRVGGLLTVTIGGSGQSTQRVLRAVTEEGSSAGQDPPSGLCHNYGRRRVVIKEALYRREHRRPSKRCDPTGQPTRGDRFQLPSGFERSRVVPYRC